MTPESLHDLETLNSDFDFEFKLEDNETEGEAVKLRESLKTEDELSSYIIAENCSDEERILLLLESRNPIQCIAAFAQIPELIKKEDVTGSVFVKKIFPLLEELMKYSNLRSLQPVLKALEICIESLSSHMETSHIHRYLLPLLLLMIENLNAFTSDTFKLTALETFSAMQQTQSNTIFLLLEKFYRLHGTASSKLLTELQNLVHEKVNVMGNSHDRIVGANLLGILLRFGAARTDRSLFKTCVSICQDVDSDIRACMCSHLPLLVEKYKEENSDTLTKRFIAMNVELSDDEVEGAVTREICELLNDEEDYVQFAAFNASVELIQVLPPKLFKEKILPVWLDILEKLSKIKSVGVKRSTTAYSKLEVAVIQNLGPVIYSLVNKNVLNAANEDDSKLLDRFVEQFRAYATHLECEDEQQIQMEQDETTSTVTIEGEVRRMCAYNFPGILKAFGGSKYAKHFHDILISLCGDPLWYVRAAVALGFHEICEILGKPRVARYLMEQLIMLLQDRDKRVKKAMVKKIDKILGSFDISDEEKKSECYRTVFPALLNFINDINVCNDWRFQVQCMSHIISTLVYFEPYALHSKLLPTLIRRMRTGAGPVIDSACRTLCYMISNSSYLGIPRFDILSNLKQEFLSHSSSSGRFTFIYLLKHALEMFSFEFFAVHLAHSAIQLLEDPVALVRLRMCSLLPRMKLALDNAPNNKHLQDLFHDIIEEKLTNDSDVNIRFEIQKLKITRNVEKLENELVLTNAAKLKKENSKGADDRKAKSASQGRERENVHSRLYSSSIQSHTSKRGTTGARKYSRYNKPNPDQHKQKVQVYTVPSIPKKKPGVISSKSPRSRVYC